MIEGHLIIPIRAERWHDGNLVEETPTDADGKFERPLACGVGDVIYAVWEIAREVAVLPREAQIERIR